MIWEVYTPSNDSDKFSCGHVFDYSKRKEAGVENGIFQLEFTTKEKTGVIDQFESLINDILDFLDSQKPVKAPQEETKSKSESKTKASSKSEESGEEVLFKGKGHLFIYNKEDDKNEVIDEDVVFAIRQTSSNYEYAFTVYDNADEMLINTKIHNSTQTSINKESGTIMWIHDTFKSEDDELDAYLFYFIEEKADDMNKLKWALSKCMFESQRKVDYEDNIKEEDMDWLADAYVEDEAEELKTDEDEDVDMYDGIDDDSREYFEDQNQEFENHEMIQAHTFDRTFVARGDGFGVYSADDQNEVKFYGDVPIIKEYQDSPAENLMLYDNEK